MMIAQWKKISLTLAMASVMVGCSATNQKTQVKAGGLAGGEKYEIELNEEPRTQTDLPETNKFTYVKPLDQSESDIANAELISQSLPSDDTVEVTTEALRIGDFVHAVFGTSLGVNYVLSDEVARMTDTVTLSLNENVSSRKLFLVTNELLKSKKVEVAERDGVFYIFPATQQNNDVTIGIGNKRSDVPQGYSNILQIIPLRYGVNSSIERTVKSLSQAQITPDYNRGVIFAQGARDQIIRLIDLVSLLDQPAHQGKHIGIVELTYVDTEEFINQAQSLLSAEGVESSVNKRGNEPVIFVPLTQIGAVAVFSGTQTLLERVQFWSDRIDQPTEGNQKRFYLYNPIYARAADLGSSIRPLLNGGGSNKRGDNTRSTESAFDSTNSDVQNSDNTSSSSGSNSGGSLNGESIELTVDDRSNKLIFYATGEQYQTLLPIIRQLDIMPKQILLEATIAEITLTEEFAQGFEFAIQNGDLSIGNLGSFGVEDIAGLAGRYVSGMDEFIARLSATNSKVNVLSNPRLVVRDGISATISVGTDIPTVGSTTTDPINSNRQTTNVNYRKTGIQLSVTPTVNAQGLVVMAIDQKISNTTDTSSTVAGSPAIFERSIKTEVLANSGQTILLGGLVSEDVNNSRSRIPGLGDIPGIGALFSSQRESTTKTELVIFITPRVVADLSSWDGILDQLNSGLQTLEVNSSN